MGMRKIRPLARRIDTTSGTEKWYRMRIEQGELASMQISWASATFTMDAPVFYTSNWEQPAIPADGAAAPDLEQWTLESSIVGTAVTASAAGSQMYHVGNNGAAHALVKINPTQTETGVLSVHAHVKD